VSTGIAEKIRQEDFNRTSEVKISGDTGNCEAGEDSGAWGLRGEGAKLSAVSTSAISKILNRMTQESSE